MSSWSARGKIPRGGFFDTPGAGSVMQLLGDLLVKQARAPRVSVPCKGGAAALNGVVGGVLPAAVTALPNLVPMHKAGKLRILAVTSESLVDCLPDVSTFAASGFPEMTATEYRCLVGRRERHKEGWRSTPSPPTPQSFRSAPAIPRGVLVTCGTTTVTAYQSGLHVVPWATAFRGCPLGRLAIPIATLTRWAMFIWRPSPSCREHRLLIVARHCSGMLSEGSRKLRKNQKSVQENSHFLEASYPQNHSRPRDTESIFRSRLKDSRRAHLPSQQP